MQKYRLKRNDYPGHKIGDIAIFDNEIDDTHFIWEKEGNLKFFDKSIYFGKEIIPKIFQPDVTPEWFEMFLW